MRISVALATRNGARFLPAQLASLAEQTHAPHELVVCDDCSTDRTLSVLEAFRAQAAFPVTICVNQQQIGYAENFLQAASRCSGDFIAFCDQDDVWLRSKLQRCAELLLASSATLLIHRNVVATENLTPTRRRIPAFRRSFTAGALSVQPWFIPPGNAMIFSQSVLGVDFTRRPRSRSREASPMTHDEWTYFIATALGRTHFSSEALVHYRQHDANVYGAPRRPRLRKALPPGDYGFLAERAFERSGFFDELARTASVNREHYVQAANHYQRLAGRLEARAVVYSPNVGTGERIQRFAHLAASGGYRGRTRGGLGLRSLLKDAIVSAVVQRRSSVAPSYASAAQVASNQATRDSIGDPPPDEEEHYLSGR
jgi:glycosyltransferase involved in cell wall biosynthesis